MAIKKSDTHRSVADTDIKKHIVGEAQLTEQDTSLTGQDTSWDVKKGEVHSDTKLEDDKGEGRAVIIRAFDFKANPETFHQHIPTRQELFNAHYKQIEVSLMVDGMKVFDEVAPRVMLSKDKTGYRIMVGALPARGHLLHTKPQTLTQIAHDTRRD